MPTNGRIRMSRPLAAYLAVLGVALLIIAGASLIWSSTALQPASAPAVTAR